MSTEAKVLPDRPGKWRYRTYQDGKPVGEETLDVERKDVPGHPWLPPVLMAIVDGEPESVHLFNWIGPA